MQFVIIGHDGPDGQAKRPTHRPAHLARLEQLQAEGRLVLAGPFTDKAGSLIIIDVESEAEAHALAQADPYVTHGVFVRVEIHPFLQVLPKAEH
jgi:uncharacterized protein YciI